MHKLPYYLIMILKKNQFIYLKKIILHEKGRK